MTKSAIVREARILQTFVGLAVAMAVGLAVGGF